MHSIEVVLAMLLAVVASGYLVRIIRFALPLPLVQIALGAVIAGVLGRGVRLDPEGLLAALLPRDAAARGTIAVNSLHNQGIARLAPGLVAEAWAPDGTIEAVRVADATGFALGVQWHPEYDWEHDANSRSVFEAFGRAVAAWVATRAGVGEPAAPAVPLIQAAA